MSWRSDDADAAPRTVFIVGAGFSRAINGVLPTMRELGDAIVSRIGTRENHWLPESVRDDLRRGRVPLGNLEQWLSFLADPPPFVDEATRHYNAGLFSEVRGLMAHEIDAAQRRTYEADMPEWLEQLTVLWLNTNATVITFNYDTLIEAAVQEVCSRIDSAHPRVMPGRAPNVVVGPPLAAWHSPQSDPTMRLLKLHGSLDWFGTPNDKTGTTFTRSPLTNGWGHRWSMRTPLPLSHEPLIIPPLAQKSQFYDNDLIRYLWGQAREAIEGAQRVVVCGYSVPLTDFATVSLLGQWGSRDAHWTLADVASDDVLERVRMLRTTAQRVEAIPGPRPIEDFVDRWSERLAQDFAPQVRSEQIGVITDDMPVLVHVLPGRVQPARSAAVTNDGVVIAIDTRPDLRRWTPDGTELTWSGLRAALSEGGDDEVPCPVLVRNGCDGKGFVGGAPRMESFHNGLTYISCVFLKCLGYKAG